MFALLLTEKSKGVPPVAHVIDVPEAGGIKNCITHSRHWLGHLLLTRLSMAYTKGGQLLFQTQYTMSNEDRHYEYPPEMSPGCFLWFCKPCGTTALLVDERHTREPKAPESQEIQPLVWPTLRMYVCQ